MDARVAPHVLYIDDDDGLRRLVRRALERRGFRVSAAADGPAGVALAAEGGVDLVAVDHYMPGQDGLTTLGQIMALPSPPPVIYVTGSEESRVAVAALKAGAIDFVVKTLGEDFFDLLARAIDQALVQVSLRAEKERAEAALRETNARLQALLHEVNHRVANSLQLVSAFVHMQSRVAVGESAKAALADTQRRIAAIAQVHRRLYTSDSVNSVDMAEYLGALLEELEETWSTPESPRALSLSAQSVRLNTDKAVAVGVIVNELVSNACKYAYPPHTAGQVRVDLRQDGDSFLLRVEDDGCGMPADGEIKGTGLGSRLIRAMATTLRAAITYDESGAACAPSFAPPVSAMRQASGQLELRTARQGLVEFTDQVARWVGTQDIAQGLLTLFCRHTSASLLIQENAARAVRTDIETYFARLAPESPDYAHDDEGPDDMPAHLRTALTQVSLSIPVTQGRMVLGTWQGIYLFEHRRRPHLRQVACPPDRRACPAVTARALHA